MDLIDPQTSPNFSVPFQHAQDAGFGLSDKTIRFISSLKGEPRWLLDFRLSALEIFRRRKLPDWAPQIVDRIDFDQIQYYLGNSNAPRRSWDQVPKAIRETFERLGVPEKERAFLAGVEAQFDSEMAYSNLQKDLAARGVIFVNSTDGLLKHEKIFRSFFARLVPARDNKFSALNSAVFSGGSFIYIPKGLKLDRPLQAYFRINAERFGQFERTLIIADEDSEVTYLEGCTAPRFETATLHAAVVELFALRNAKIQYITVQNWSNNVFNLVTKRGRAEENAEIRWIDCNIGSRLTMKYPAIILAGKQARGEMVSISVASAGQHQDTGAKMIHLADSTSSTIVAKSISVLDGLASYRGLVQVAGGRRNCRSYSQCDAMLIHSDSASQTFPRILLEGNLSKVQHEAAISKLSEEAIFYLQQRGIPRTQAIGLSVNGFLNDLLLQFPPEYGLELRRLLQMEVDSCFG